MLYFSIPYSLDKKLLEAYDHEISRLPNNDDWLCMLDGDTAFLRSDFGHHIADYIAKYPNTGLFTCLASRCHYKYLRLPDADDKSPDIIYHKKIADRQAQNHRLDARKINSIITGHLMAIKKETWLKIKKRVFNTAKNETLEAVDTAISKAILEINADIICMDGIYLLHYCRLKEGYAHRNHLGYKKEIFIITPSARPQNLHRIAESINLPKASFTWIVVIDATKPVNPALLPPKAEIHYHHNPASIAGHAQRNYAIDVVMRAKKTHSLKPYLYFLDDDTLLHPDFYKSVADVESDFIHFNQQNPDGTKRIGGTVKVNHIDTGSALVSLDIVKGTRWNITLYNADGIFLQEVFNSAKNPVYINKTLSTYNLLQNPGHTAPPPKQKKISVVQKPAAISGPLDLVYVLGSGTAWRNNEIRYSLRSVEKNLTNYRNIFVVGENPGFTQNIIHIPFPDMYGQLNADGNMIEKVLAACNHPMLSDNFVYMNDDAYFIKPLDATAITPFHKGDLNSLPASFWAETHWRKRLYNTLITLQAYGLTTLHFDHHAPVIFNKAAFVETMQQFNYAHDIGLNIKSLYGNINTPFAPMLSHEKVKVFSKMSLAQIESLTANATYLAINDAGINSALKVFMQQSFPEQCRYEASPLNDLTAELVQWQQSGCPHPLAVEIYNRHFPGKNFGRLISKHNSEAIQKKLSAKLKMRLSEI